MMLLFVAATAHAEGLEPTVEEHGRRPPPREHRRAGGPPPVPPQPDHAVTLRVGAELTNPHVTAGAEIALGRRASVGLDGGLGGYSGGMLYDARLQGRGYPVGDFDRGFFVGVGAGVTNLTPLTLGDPATTVEANIGGKYTFPFGFTVDGSVGLAYFGMPELGFIAPAGRVGVGWSF